KAAQAFLDFLLSDRIQKESVVHGYRPANPNVAVKFPGSPFSEFARYGVQDTLGKMCEPPKSEVLSNLLTAWSRTQAGREHMWRCLNAAFFSRLPVPGLGEVPVNLLGLTAFGVLGLINSGFWFLGTGVEATFLWLLASNPRFQRSINAAQALGQLEIGK